MSWHYQLLWRWPDLVITFLGVLLGALLALLIERGVASWQLKKQTELSSRLDTERLNSHLQRVKIEVRDNALYVKKLIGDALQGAPTANSPARQEYIRWAAILADALSVEAYEDLAASGLQRKLPADLQSDLFDARQMTLGLKHMIKSGAPAVAFYENYVPGGEGNKKAQNILTYAQTVQEALVGIRDDVYSFLREASPVDDTA